MSRLNLSHASQPTIKISLKTHLNSHYRKHLLYILLFPFMNICQVEAQVLDPGRDDSSSGGESDLGATQNSLEVWTFT